MAQLDFDPSGIEPLQPMGALPKGRYTVIVDGSEIKDTKSGTGQYLQVTYRVTEGEYANRLIWGRYNIRNANPQAEEIARRELAALCAAVGITGKVNDSSEFHGRALSLDLAIESDDQGRENNRIKGYVASGGVIPHASAAKPSPSKATPPWKKAAA